MSLKSGCDLRGCEVLLIKFNTVLKIISHRFGELNF